MNNHRYWLALSHLFCINHTTLRRCLEYFTSIDKLFSASTSDLQLAGMKEKTIQRLKNINWQIVEKDLQWLQKNHCHIISWEDKNYPAILREIHDPPFVLYVQGNVNLLNEPQIAIVGTRHPTVTGKELAHQFAKELASSGWIITSGLALGIDAASHQGALDVNGKTIAVLGTGFKFIYPRPHQKLAEEIIQKNGALISEFLPDTPPKTMNFPIRNRIISGLSLGVLVVEAAVRSGSLITARLAMEQNREVFAIPGSIHNPMARGCHQLIHQGAKLVETSQDILDEVQCAFRPEKKPTPNPVLKEPVDLDPTLKRVLAQIGYEVTALDVIIARSGLTAAEVSSMLLPLELEGYVRVVPGGYLRE